MLLHHMNFSANNKKVENPQTDSDWLTRDGEQVAKYKADPLCGFPFTARAYADMFDGLRRLYPEHLSAMKKDVPVLLFAGDHDPVGSNGQGVRQVYEEIRAARRSGCDAQALRGRTARDVQRDQSGRGLCRPNRLAEQQAGLNPAWKPTKER